MKSFCIIILIFTANFQFIWGQNVEQAIEYNDAIIDEHDKILAKFGDLFNSYEDYIPEKMDSAYSATQKQIKEGLTFIEKIKPFKGDSTFKKGAYSLFKTYLSTLKIEHKRIIELLKLPEQDYGSEEVAEFEKLSESANKKIKLQWDKLVTIQEKFAEAHKFEIITEDE